MVLGRKRIPSGAIIRFWQLWVRIKRWCQISPHPTSWNKIHIDWRTVASFMLFRPTKLIPITGNTCSIIPKRIIMRLNWRPRQYSWFCKVGGRKGDPFWRYYSLLTFVGQNTEMVPNFPSSYLLEHDPHWLDDRVLFHAVSTNQIDSYHWKHVFHHPQSYHH